MFDHEKETLTNCVAKALKLKTKKDKEAIRKGVEDYFKDKIAMSWNIEDVMHVAEEEDMKISDDDALYILNLCMNEHDANDGINWDTIRYWLTNKL